jgi:hypothetical protein
VSWDPWDHHRTAFAWTGTRRLFDACGFAAVGNPDGGKQRVRKGLT